MTCGGLLRSATWRRVGVDCHDGPVGDMQAFWKLRRATRDSTNFLTMRALFKRRHFDGQIIILCVSWYTSFKLSLRDLVIMMADPGITLTQGTTYGGASLVRHQGK